MGHKETLGGDGYVYYLDSGDGIMGYGYVRTHQIIYIKCAVFYVCINCTLIKLLKKNNLPT